MLLRHNALKALAVTLVAASGLFAQQTVTGPEARLLAGARAQQAASREAPGAPDPGLLKEINQIKAIDNHAHPPALNGPHGEPDEDYDALPCDPLEPTDAGLFFREDNPVYIKAWQTMFGYKYDDFKPEHVQELLAAKEQVKKREGDNYPSWVLDQLGIQTELANRVALGPGQYPPRFRWDGFGTQQDQLARRGE